MRTPIRQGENAAFDPGAVMRQVGGDRELLREIAALFLETTPQLLSEIRDAMARVDGPALVAATHSLRGSARNFCAPRVEEAGLRLEQIGHSRVFLDGQAAYESLRAEVGTLCSQLQAMVREDTAGGQGDDDPDCRR